MVNTIGNLAAEQRAYPRILRPLQSNLAISELRIFQNAQKNYCKIQRQKTALGMFLMQPWHLNNGR